MARYAMQRVMMASVSLFIVISAVFFSVRMMPGDIVDQFFQDTGSQPGQAEALREQLGLNDPVPVQFVHYLTDLLQGDFGTSLWTGRELLPTMMQRAPVTLELGVMTLILGLAVGLPLGVISAVFRGSVLDYVLRTISIGSISIPYFWIAILSVALPAFYWRWSPPIGFVSLREDPIANIQHLLIPSIMLAIALSGSIMRMLRATMLEVLRLDYMRTAAAKGLSLPVRIRRHALRNALIPVVTLVGLNFIFLLSGSVVVETIYGLPGLGQLTIDALARRDYEVVQGVTIFMAIVITMGNLLVDLSYGFIDPRIRIQR